MDLERSLRFHFDDQEWLKQLLIGGLVGVIPIVNVALQGYALRVLKNVTQDRETPLPTWDDFGDYFVKGLLATLGSLIYMLPILILGCIGGAAEWGRNGADTASVFSICLGCLSALWALLIGIVLPAAFTKYAVSGEFAVFFRFGELFRYIADNLGNYIIALLVTIVTAIAASIVGGLFCGVGVILTTPWATLVWAHLLAQVYKSSVAKTVAPAAV